jgi:hypothetical protein
MEKTWANGSTTRHADPCGKAQLLNLGRQDARVALSGSLLSRGLGTCGSCDRGAVQLELGSADFHLAYPPVIYIT